MPEARISVDPTVTTSYGLPSSWDGNNDAMTVSLSSSTVLPPYISFDPANREFIITSPNTAILNDIVDLQYELSDGYNKTTLTT